MSDRRRRSGVVVLMMLVSSLAVAGPSMTENGRKEIDHLRAQIAGSECVFLRNQQEHDRNEALAHIAKKAEYYRDRIHSAEDFIEYAASRSMLSGEPYRVRCPDRDEVLVRRWLFEVLKQYREAGAVDR